MTEFIKMIILAVVQGLTEFLPVSSSGHLVLTQHLLGAQEGDIFFDIVLHVGTLGSVMVVYWREIFRLLKFDKPAISYILCLVVGTLPAVVVGLLAKDFIESLFHSPLFAAGGLIFTALILFSTRFTKDSTLTLPEPWEPQSIPLKKSLLIGTAQAFAILPGISRSGSTIAASMWIGLARAEAARFSFLLSIPAISGALVLQLIGGEFSGREDLPLLVVSAFAAFAVGLVAIRLTALAVVRDHFWKFSFYCLIAGVVAFIILTST
ncbi:MAG: undecaprenyl-diphosphate phosphatase [bacterium]|nr:undecaprenyl-diphosphate phosphatase [bacterium]